MRSRRDSKTDRLGRGWDAVGSPVPGNIPEALAELGLHVYKITDMEAHAHCPGHLLRTGRADTNPSWSVNIESGLHGCWSCGYVGNFQQLVEDLLDLDRAEANGWIRSRGSIELVKRKMNPAPPVYRPAMTEAALALFVDPPPAACASRFLDLEVCRAYGVLWSTFKDCWIVPIRDADGKLLGWQEKNEKYFRNRPDNMKKSGSLFGLTQFTGRTAILVESPLDTIRIASCGLSGALASFGVRVSDEQLSHLVERADEVVLALDNDRDGIAMTHELLTKLSVRVSTKVWNYTQTEAKDPGEQNANELLWSYRNAIGGLAYRLGRF